MSDSELDALYLRYSAAARRAEPTSGVRDVLRLLAHVASTSAWKPPQLEQPAAPPASRPMEKRPDEPHLVMYPVEVLKGGQWTELDGREHFFAQGHSYSMCGSWHLARPGALARFDAGLDRPINAECSGCHHELRRRLPPSSDGRPT